MIVKAVIEIPKGSVYKYEVDKQTGRLIVDRPLPEPLPYNYGYILDTHYKDGDPLDVCIVGDFPIQPLAEVEVEVLGMFVCDDNGDVDDKLIAVVKNELPDSEYDVTLPCKIDEVERYLSTYKKGFEVLEYVGVQEAEMAYAYAKQAFEEKHNS